MVGKENLVDIIHSDGNRLLLALGIGKPIGHIDFFPNGNRVMPGCVTRSIKDATVQGIVGIIVL